MQGGLGSLSDLSVDAASALKYKTFKTIARKGHTGLFQETHVSDASIAKMRKEHSMHVLFASPGITPNGGGLISTISKQFLKQFRWMVPEEVAAGRALKLWFIGEKGIFTVTNLHLKPKLSGKNRRALLQKVGYQLPLYPSSDIVGGDFNIPPRDEFPENQNLRTNFSALTTC